MKDRWSVAQPEVLLLRNPLSGAIDPLEHNISVQRSEGFEPRILCNSFLDGNCTKLRGLSLKEIAKIENITFFPGVTSIKTLPSKCDFLDGCIAKARCSCQGVILSMRDDQSVLIISQGYNKRIIKPQEVTVHHFGDGHTAVSCISHNNETGECANLEGVNKEVLNDLVRAAGLDPYDPRLRQVRARCRFLLDTFNK